MALTPGACDSNMVLNKLLLVTISDEVWLHVLKVGIITESWKEKALQVIHSFMRWSIIEIPISHSGTI